MNPTTRFSDRANDYAVARPSYGADVIACVLAGLGPTPRVADLGAGTGISSRLLADAGADVSAIEPNASMREQARSRERVQYVNASAEATTLAPGSVDLASAFQAFHWFAVPAAIAEIVRVVRPGGRAALVLNERDERDAFTAAYGELIRRYALDDTEARRMTSIDEFQRLPGIATRHEFANRQDLDRAGLVRRTASSSYLPKDGPSAAALFADLEALFVQHARAEHITIALRTIVVCVDLP